MIKRKIQDQLQRALEKKLNKVKRVPIQFIDNN